MPSRTSSSSSSSSANGGNWFANKIHLFHDGHERVKNAVHSYWRQNTILSPRGKFGKVAMSCVYFSVPVVLGYVVVTKIVDGAESTARERLIGGGGGDKKRYIDGATDGRSSIDSRVGAGGWGGGVHLATSDEQTQDVNRINLERFLKKQRKLRDKQEQETAAADAAAAK
eukprot:CAMPEP_0197177204 /NCGR_PEP_ID=MMETSP1423-20130617/2903_1 /TAXON_ID=476441 /ORGANISM="Pseudo-nitzschia heimii, Strain UNC1101" /LENGTH=169 /DNA_ID=CAMNT_0042626725 /DNA_START=88 /DNA_END=597 /DNA_ORIENTATION=+